MFTNGNDTVFFQGQLGQLTVTLVNAYDGLTISIDEEKNINTSTYDGLQGNDTLFMTSFGDALFIEREDETTGQVTQTVARVEVFSAGNGGDVIDLSSTLFTIGNVTIIGGAGDDILWANAGNDYILGGGGNDFLHGGPGNDDLRGGSGNDLMVGGSGFDVYGITSIAEGEVDTIIEEGSSETNNLYFFTNNVLSDLSFSNIGNDLIIDVATGGQVIVKGHFDTENSGIDTIRLINSGEVLDARTIEQSHDVVLDGTDGDDVLEGDIGNDTLSGGEGSDLLSGGAGNDILNFSADAIWPNGFVAWNVGSPDDVINGARIKVNPRFRNFDGFDGGEGIDTIQMGDDGEALFLDDRYSANPFGFNTARIVDIEIIRAGGGNDIVDLTSKQFSYGDVSLYGDGGNDVLWSSAGNDFIDGGIGNDHIDGGAGNDILLGGAGVDTLYGRGGDDIFVFEGETAFDPFDQIMDWNDGDKLDISDILSDIGFDPLSDALSDFVDIKQQGGHSFLRIDQDGAGGDEFFVSIARINNQSLTLDGLIADDALITDPNVI